MNAAADKNQNRGLIRPSNPQTRYKESEQHRVEMFMREKVFLSRIKPVAQRGGKWRILSQCVAENGGLCRFLSVFVAVWRGEYPLY